jgi:hypothetical protein
MFMKKHVGGHPEWDRHHRLIGTIKKQQVAFEVNRQEIVETLGDEKVFPNAEGDIALSPDAAWLVNGHGENSKNYYTFFHRASGDWTRSTGYNIRGYESGDLRCDPAPAWNRNNQEIVFPAIAKDGTRQMFLIRIK